MSEEVVNNTDQPKVSQSSQESLSKLVKSTAIVKYSAALAPATFAQLQCNTDLKLPPSNWLSSSAESYGLQSDCPSQSRSFSSFRMAHMFPDCVGEVDVVSDAENIKKLLKMPYSHSMTSMVVHRIENTLLIDDFNVHGFLLRQAKDDWDWLKTFVSKHVFQGYSDKEKKISHKSSRTSIQEKNLVSKFLYHSLVIADNKQHKKKPTLPIKTLEPSLPEPSREEKLPDPNCNHNFARNVLWTFENIQMLIGTDMPIFGGPAHSCISLRLRDMSKPISVLTGIDYWLDNLMSNVPEVVMCYHIDGFVQKYELIKTEDLPNLEDAKFNPKVVRDVAQNILCFLKNNATKAGHTYWLFKPKNDDVVKLYDLTSLCSEVNDYKGQSPFTVPVAMLLYRVARNMTYSVDYSKNRGTIRVLLKNCIQLLATEKYPQIVTSAHYMMSDLYVPANTNPVKPDLMEQNDEEDIHNSSNSSHESDDNSEKMEDCAIKYLSLSTNNGQTDDNQVRYKPPPITGTIEEKCKIALEHVARGLECLQYFPTQDESDEQQKSSENSVVDNEIQQEELSEEILRMAKPHEAIPIPYTPLSEVNEIADSITNNSKKKNKQKKQKKPEKNIPRTSTENLPKSILCKPGNLPTWQAPKKSDNLSWKAHLRTLLYEKASLIFGVLAEREYTKRNYGSALHYISAVLRCQRILEVSCDFSNIQMKSYFLGRIGDCGFMAAMDKNNLAKHKADFETKNEYRMLIDEICSIDSSDYNDVKLPKNFDDIEETLLISYSCYEEALNLSEQNPSEDRDNLLRRVGNIHNEIGVYYMNKASELFQSVQLSTEDNLLNNEEIMRFFELSKRHLNKGVKSFEAVNDSANLALLHANFGRLMRTRAHMHEEELIEQRGFYEEALVHYEKAIEVLNLRKSNPLIWDTVMWEYSTALFSMATLLQDFPVFGNKSVEDLEREVVDILQKALKYCDTETPGGRQPIYQYRAATILHRLGSFYHKIYRDSRIDPDSVKRKTSYHLSKVNYERSAKIFLFLEEIKEYLTVQLERVALIESQAQSSANVSNKIKSYRNALEIILSCRAAFDILIKQKKNELSADRREDSPVCFELKNNIDCQKSDKERVVEEEKKETGYFGDLLDLFKQRLQFLLQTLLKLHLNQRSNSNRNKESDPLIDSYKKSYELSLRQKEFSGVDLLQHLTNIIKKIEEILE